MAAALQPNKASHYMAATGTSLEFRCERGSQAQAGPFYLTNKTTFGKTPWLIPGFFGGLSEDRIKAWDEHHKTFGARITACTQQQLKLVEEAFASNSTELAKKIAEEGRDAFLVNVLDTDGRTLFSHGDQRWFNTLNVFQASPPSLLSTLPALNKRCATVSAKSGILVAKGLEFEAKEKALEISQSVVCVNLRIQKLTRQKKPLQYQKENLNTIFGLSELTRRLTPEQRKAIIAEWEKSNFSDADSKNFAQKMNTATVINMSKMDTAKMLIDKSTDDAAVQKTPALALGAVFEGLISEEQFATICMVQEAVDQFFLSPIVVHAKRQIDANGMVADICLAIPLTSDNDITYTKRLGDLGLFKEFFCFSDIQMEIFTEAVKLLPPSEQWYYTFDVPLGSLIGWSPMYDALCHAMNVSHLQNKFTEAEEADAASSERQKFLIIPSFSMFQLFFDIMFNKDAVTLVPMLGVCSTGTIEKHVKLGQRVVSIGMPKAQLKTHADGRIAGSYMVTLHDVYHALKYSKIKNNIKMALGYINCLFDEALKKESGNKDLKKIKWVLIDGDFEKLDTKFGQLFSEEVWKGREKFIQRIIWDMVVKKEKWKTDFQLTKEDLLDRERQIYEASEAACKLEG